MLKNKLYFAYGANMHPESMQWRCPAAVAQGALILNNWELKFYNHATIEHRRGARVAGVLWQLTDQCERNLDAFEGYPHYYTKRAWAQDGVEFFFYEMTSPKTGTPSSVYVSDIAESYALWQLPEKLLAESLQSHA